MKTEKQANIVDMVEAVSRQSWVFQHLQSDAVHRRKASIQQCSLAILCMKQDTRATTVNMIGHERENRSHTNRGKRKTKTMKKQPTALTWLRQSADSRGSINICMATSFFAPSSQASINAVSPYCSSVQHNPHPDRRQDSSANIRSDHWHSCCQ